MVRTVLLRCLIALTCSLNIPAASPSPLIPSSSILLDTVNREADRLSPVRHNGSVFLPCGGRLSMIDSSLLDDLDVNIKIDIWNHSLSRGIGDSNVYQIRDYLDPSGLTATFESARYISGENGQALIDAGGDDHVYGFANPESCTDASIRDNALISGPHAIAVDAEHIIDPDTASYFFEFIQNPELDLLDGNGPTRAPAHLQAISFDVIRDYMAVPYTEWPEVRLTLPWPADESLFLGFAYSLGSSSNMAVMTNLQTELKTVKSRIWNSYSLVTPDDVWHSLADNPTTENTRDALNLLRSGIAIFNFLNNENVQIRLGHIHDRLSSDTSRFDQLFNTCATTHEPTNLRGLWITFINFWAIRIANNHRTYANKRIASLISPWNNLSAQNPTRDEAAIATTNLADIETLSIQILNLLFDRSKLT